jgi:hypothetical protein
MQYEIQLVFYLFGEDDVALGQMILYCAINGSFHQQLAPQSFAINANA